MQAHSWTEVCIEKNQDKKVIDKAKEIKMCEYLTHCQLSGIISLCVTGKPTTICETIGKADIWLIRTYWDFEYPRPLLPNFKFVGGLHCKPAKPLPKVMTLLSVLKYLLF